MSPPVRLRLLALLALVALAAGYLFLIRWRPEAEIRRHQRAWFRAVESADWQRAAALTSPSYQDDWELSREELLEALQEGRAQFLYLDIEATEAVTAAGRQQGVFRSVLRLEGSGHALAQDGMRRFNRIRTPFVFTWERSGPRAWDWHLVEISQPELDPGELRSAADFFEG